MIVAKFISGATTTAYGLTQWDYGQELVLECAGVEIPDGTEINYYQGKLSSIAYLKNNHSLIPDIMLQNAVDITAYVYIRSPSSGETVLSVKLHIRERPRPENYVLPEYKDYSRLLPPGGSDGQALIKRSNEDYDTQWADDAGIEAMTDDEIDLLFE